MKKTCLTLSLIFALTLPIYAQFDPGILVKGHRYVSESGFSITVPKSWDIKENWMSTNLVAIAPFTNKSDIFPETLAVDVVKIGAETLDQFYRITLSDMQVVAKDLRVSAEGKTEMDNQPARWVMYTHQLGKLTLEVLQFVTIHNGHAYVLKFSSTVHDFHKFHKNFEEMAHTFRF